MASEPKVLNTWQWKAVGAPLSAASKKMPLPLKATLQAAVAAAVGYFIYYKWHHIIGPSVIWSLAGLMLIGGWFYPPIFHGFEKVGAKLAHWVASGLTWLLLVPFFYIAFTIGRFFLILGRKDPMDCSFPDAERTTFWTPRPIVEDMKQYQKQH